MPHLMPMSWLFCFVCMILAWFVFYMVCLSFVSVKKQVFSIGAMGSSLMSKYFFNW